MGELTTRRDGTPPTKAELIQSLKSGDASTLHAVGVALTTPAGGEWMAGQIVALQRVYSNSQSASPIDDAAIMIWLRVLDGLPRFAIEEACIEYASRDTSFAPKPGEIRALADRHVAHVKTAEMKLRSPHLVARDGERVHQPTPEERARNQEFVADVLSGFKSNRDKA